MALSNVYGEQEVDKSAPAPSQQAAWKPESAVPQSTMAPGWNLVTMSEDRAFEQFPATNEVWVFDQATQKQRKLSPGEVVPAGSAVWLNAQGAGTGAPSPGPLPGSGAPEPAPAGVAPTASADPRAWMQDPRLSQVANVRLRPGLNDFVAQIMVPPYQLQGLFDAGAKIYGITQGGAEVPLSPGDRLLEQGRYRIVMPGDPNMGATGAPPGTLARTGATGAYQEGFTPSQRANLIFPGATAGFVPFGMGNRGFQIQVGPDGTPTFRDAMNRPLNPADEVAARSTYDFMMTAGPRQDGEATTGPGGAQWDPYQGVWTLDRAAAEAGYNARARAANDSGGDPYMGLPVLLPGMSAAEGGALQHANGGYWTASGGNAPLTYDQWLYSPNNPRGTTDPRAEYQKYIEANPETPLNLEWFAAPSVNSRGFAEGYMAMKDRERLRAVDTSLASAEDRAAWEERKKADPMLARRAARNPELENQLFQEFLYPRWGNQSVPQSARDVMGQWNSWLNGSARPMTPAQQYDMREPPANLPEGIMSRRDYLAQDRQGDYDAYLRGQYALVLQGQQQQAELDAAAAAVAVPPASQSQQPPAAPAGGGSGGSGTGTGTGSAGSGAIAGPAGGPYVMQYGSDVWQNLPALKLITGQISPEEYSNTQAAPSNVPGLGVTLPAPGQLNPSLIAYLQATDPDGYQALLTMFAAGNRNLAAEAQRAGYYASPAAQSTPTSAIRT